MLLQSVEPEDGMVSQDDILDWNTAKAKLKPTKKTKSAGHVLGLTLFGPPSLYT